MSLTLTPEAAADECWTREYWLRHCEGYRVESLGGRIGHVDSIVVSDADEPVALVVRRGIGTGCVTFVIPVEEIRELEPSVERILVDDVPPPVRVECGPARVVERVVAEQVAGSDEAAVGELEAHRHDARRAVEAGRLAASSAHGISGPLWEPRIQPATRCG